MLSHSHCTIFDLTNTILFGESVDVGEFGESVDVGESVDDMRMTPDFVPKLPSSFFHPLWWVHIVLGSSLCMSR